MIQLTNVSLSVNAKAFLKDVSLTAKEGEITVLLGPSSAGKSTICNVITGVLAQSSGTATVDGVDMLTSPVEAKRHIGYVPQSSAAYRDATPRTYLRFIGQAREMSSRELGEAVEKVIKQTKLTDVATVPIRNLPPVYQQRVAVAQALIADMKNIVLDAPTDALDAKQKLELRQILRDAAEGRTILLSTSNITEAEALGDVVYLLDAGRIVTRTSVRELAWQTADDGKTEIAALCESEPLMQVLTEAKLEAVSEPQTVDGVTRVTVTTGAGLDDKKQLFAALAKANILLVEMRPVKLSLEETILNLKNDSPAIAQQAGEA